MTVIRETVILENEVNDFWFTPLGQAIDSIYSVNVLNLILITLVIIGVIGTIYWLFGRPASELPGLKTEKKTIETEKKTLEAENKALKARLEGYELVFAEANKYFDEDVTDVGTLLHTFRARQGGLSKVVNDLRRIQPEINALFGTTGEVSPQLFFQMWPLVVRHIEKTEFKRLEAIDTLSVQMQQNSTLRSSNELKDQEIAALKATVQTALGAAVGHRDAHVEALLLTTSVSHAMSKKAGRLEVLENQEDRRHLVAMKMPPPKQGNNQNGNQNGNRGGNQNNQPAA